jgi:hypothetical protein
MTAKTDGQVSTTTSGLGLSAANTWTDSATITVSGGATIEATGNVTLLANRTTEYSATGRSAVNTITGDTSIAIGSSTTGSTISSGGDLSIRAVDELKATAKSPKQTIDLGALGFPANIAASAAQNLITGNTKVSITKSDGDSNGLRNNIH